MRMPIASDSVGVDTERFDGLSVIIVIVILRKLVSSQGRPSASSSRAMHGVAQMHLVSWQSRR
jgi:hypothetical protein